MKKLNASVLLLAGIMAVVLVPAAASAAGGSTTSANSGVCKSGHKAKDLKSCKENGGTK